MALSVTYSKDIADEICRLMADEGVPLKQICAQEDMPSLGTVRRWVADDVNNFRNEFHAADGLKYITMEDECMEIADNSSNDYMMREDKNGVEREVLNTENINRSKLRIDTRKDFMAFRRPDIYGKRQTVEHTGKNGGPIQVEEMTNLDLARRLLWLAHIGKAEAAEPMAPNPSAPAELPAPESAGRESGE
jgi:hypothetical protein